MVSLKNELDVLQRLEQCECRWSLKVEGNEPTLNNSIGFLDLALLLIPGSPLRCPTNAVRLRRSAMSAIFASFSTQAPIPASCMTA